MIGGRRLVVAITLTAMVASTQESRPQEFPPIQLPGDWQARDLEGRWVAYRRDRDAHAKDPNRQAGWVQILAGRDDYELLEWIGIYEGWWSGAGKALVDADAPQWMRVALWNVKAYDSHNQDNAKKALGEHPARVLGWFEKYPIAQRGKGAEYYAQLREKNVEPEDPGNQLPPLDGMQLLLPQLDVPGGLEEFGDRVRAEPGKRYVHQVLRALNGLVVWGGLEPVHVHKVVALTRHADLRVRSEAFATLTKIPGALLPHRQLWAIAESDRGPKDRRLAALAFTYGAHPEVFLTMHDVLSQSDHVAWDVVVTRLGDMGNGFSVRVFEGLDKAELGFEKTVQLRGVVDKIRERINQGSAAKTPQGLAAWLERVAWAEHAGHRLSGDLRGWTVRALRTVLPGEDLAVSLEDLQAQYSRPPYFRGEDGTAVLRRFERLCNELKRQSGGGR